ncbi:endonuclease SmrB [Buchnera aphidicola (Ceratoglyphina bambusae)]|uniref:endonuclease SmrB n=1 Tax=Buchnera aphidicola TaxID=9 RepID=UPI0031B83090
MNRKKFVSYNDFNLFKKSFNKIKKIVQDNVFHTRNNYCEKKNFYRKLCFEKDFHNYSLSKKKSNSRLSYKPIKYVRSNCFNKNLKEIIYGNFFPEIFLDVHGLNIIETKRELASLLTFCHKKKISCISIIHGHGKEILKKQIPFWLSNHPDIIAFHEAPRIYGKSSSIFVIIEI